MGIRSEYQKQFKVSTLKKYLSIYYDNVAFRTARRDREYSHTPLSWCNDEATNAEVDTDSEEENGDSQSAAIGDQQHKISTATVTLSDKMSRLCVPPTVSPGKSTDEDKDRCAETCQETENNREERCKDDVSLQIEPREKKSKVATSTVRSSKDRRPDRKQKIPRASRKLHPPSRASTPSTVTHPAPFMSYGWAQSDSTLSHHKTFNIRSTADVYPAALRAHSRRKTDVKERAVSVQRSREDKVRSMLARSCEGHAEEEDWRSEYQLRYTAYDTQEYIRSLSARSRDVKEKKLCRVVYVS